MTKFTEHLLVSEVYGQMGKTFWPLEPDSGYTSATKKPIEATVQSWGRQLRSTGRFAKVARVLSNTNFANTFVGASRDKIEFCKRLSVSGCFGVTICCWFSGLRPELSEGVLTWQSKLGGAKLNGKNTYAFCLNEEIAASIQREWFREKIIHIQIDPWKSLISRWTLFLRRMNFKSSDEPCIPDLGKGWHPLSRFIWLITSIIGI